MKVLVGALGSLGDINPLLAVAVGLSKRGHDVTFASHGTFRAHVRSAGLDFVPLRPDTFPKTHSFSAHTGPGAAQRYLQSAIIPFLRETFDDILSASESVDFIVAHDLTLKTAAYVAERLRKPWVACNLSPVPTSARKWIHALLKRECDATFHGSEFSQPAVHLALFSRSFAPRAVPAGAVCTGFPFYEPHSAALPEPVASFLDKGPAPVVLTFGSFISQVAGHVHTVLAPAVNALGYRLLILGQACQGAFPVDRTEVCITTDYVPHGILFPRVCSVVHHGGIGTTAETLRHGFAATVIPFTLEQEFTAMRLQVQHLGRRVDWTRLCNRDVTDALRCALYNPAYGAAAKSFADVLQNEDGTRNACDAIEARLL